MRLLWLIQAVANALLFWCAFAWLGIRDSRTSQLIETAVFALLILIPWLWLQNATFIYCAERSLGIRGAFRKSARTLAMFSAVVIAFVVIVWAVGLLRGPFETAGHKTASWLTFHLRKPVKPATWANLFAAVLWGVRWVVVPVLVLPVAAGAAIEGARGLWRKARRLFWLEYLLALVLGFYIPSVLMHWVPKLTATTAQVLSFALRFGIAYVLIITSWIAVTFFSAARKES